MADILLVPNYEVGNGIGKAAGLFGHAKNAGIILGAKVPIVLVSRADSAYSKLASIARGQRSGRAYEPRVTSFCTRIARDSSAFHRIIP